MLFEADRIARRPPQEARSLPKPFEALPGLLSVIALATIVATLPRRAMTLPDSSGWLRFVRRIDERVRRGIQPHRRAGPARVPVRIRAGRGRRGRREARRHVPAEAAQVLVAVEARARHRGDRRGRKHAAAAREHRRAEAGEIVRRREESRVARDAAERVRARVVDVAAPDDAVDPLGRGDAGERKRREKISSKVKRAEGIRFPSSRAARRRAAPRIRRVEEPRHAADELAEHLVADVRIHEARSGRGREGLPVFPFEDLFLRSRVESHRIVGAPVPPGASGAARPSPGRARRRPTRTPGCASRRGPARRIFPSSTSAITLVAVATTFVREARSKTVSSVIGSRAGRTARWP